MLVCHLIVMSMSFEKVSRRELESNPKVLKTPTAQHGTPHNNTWLKHVHIKHKGGDFGPFLLLKWLVYQISSFMCEDERGHAIAHANGWQK